METYEERQIESLKKVIAEQQERIGELEAEVERLRCADSIIARLCIELQRRGVSVNEVYDLSKRWYSTSHAERHADLKMMEE